MSALSEVQDYARCCLQWSEQRSEWQSNQSAGAIIVKAEFAAAMMPTTVREQHPRSHHKVATSIHTHPAVRAGFEPETDGNKFYKFCHKAKRYLFAVSEQRPEWQKHPICRSYHRA